MMFFFDYIRHQSITAYRTSQHIQVRKLYDIEEDKMLFILIACAAENPCKDIDCSCPEGTGSLIIEKIKEVSIQKKDASGVKSQIIPCVASKDESLCTFTPAGSVFQVDVLIGEKSFPVDIKSVRKAKEGCCACGYFEFSPHRLTIPYH